MVRVFFCLVFFVVWAFRLLFFLVLGGGLFFFCCLGGGPGPAQTAKKNTPPPKQQKRKHVPPLPSVFFFAVWAGGCVCCFAVWAGGVFFFLLFGRGACSFFCCLGGGAFFFCCLGGGVFFFLLFGPGACFFAVWAGKGSSLTYPSAWLVFKRPNNKRDRTAKKKHGFLLDIIPTASLGRTHITPVRIPKTPRILPIFREGPRPKRAHSKPGRLGHARWGKPQVITR